MSAKFSQNEGVRVLASFDDRAVPFAPALDGPATASRSVNEGVRTLGGFDGPAQPAAQNEPETVGVLLAQIETALQTIHAALAQIRHIQSKAG